MRVANLGLKFALELCAFAALAVWGADTSVILAIAAPLVAIALWSQLAAPRSPRRLAPAPRLAFELAVFAAAVAGLVASGHEVGAIVLAVLVLANTALLVAFGQWATA